MTIASVGGDDWEMERDLEGVYRAHHRLVRWVVRSCRIPEGTIEDVVQDVFVAAGRRLAKAPPGDIRPWLVGVAKTISLNHRRSALRRQLRDESWFRASTDHGPSLDDTVASRRDLDRVLEALRTLDQAQRETLVLVELHGLDPGEVARLCGLSRNTVYSRLRIARNKLREVPCSTFERARDQGEPTTERVGAGWLAILGEMAQESASPLVPLIPVAVRPSVAWGLAGAMVLGVAVTVGGRLAVDERPDEGARRRTQSSEERTPAATPANVSLVAIPNPARAITSKPHTAFDSTSSTSVASTRTSSPTRAPSTKSSSPSTARAVQPLAASKPDELTAEAEVLLRAARYLDTGELAAAAAALREHDARFPLGALQAERAELAETFAELTKASESP